MEIPAAVVRFLGLFCRFPHRDGKMMKLVAVRRDVREADRALAD